MTKYAPMAIMSLAIVCLTILGALAKLDEEAIQMLLAGIVGAVARDIVWKKPLV